MIRFFLGSHDTISWPGECRSSAVADPPVSVSLAIRHVSSSDAATFTRTSTCPAIMPPRTRKRAPANLFQSVMALPTIGDPESDTQGASPDFRTCLSDRPDFPSAFPQFLRLPADRDMVI